MKPEQLSLGISPPTAASAFGELNSQRQVEGNKIARPRAARPLSHWPKIGTKVEVTYEEVSLPGVFSGVVFDKDPRRPSDPPHTQGRVTWNLEDMRAQGLSASLIASLPNNFLVRMSELRLLEEDR